LSPSEDEIVVEDPSAPAGDSPPLTSNRAVEIAVSLVLLALAVLLALDNRRTGMSWDSTGPQAGYFPFYLCVILGAASLYGLVKQLLSRRDAAKAFVTQAQFMRVLQVMAPTLLFCFATQWLGLYVSSFLLTAWFMAWVGRIAIWKSLLTALLFSLVMFATFELAFDVIMPKGPLEAWFGH
jgi:hypothetical protein